jgi:hypothetical protein
LIGQSNDELLGLHERERDRELRLSFGSRPTLSLFRVHLSRQQFGDNVRDSRTTKIRKRDTRVTSAIDVGRIRLCAKSIAAEGSQSPAIYGRIRTSHRTKVGDVSTT